MRGFTRFSTAVAPWLTLAVAVGIVSWTFRGRPEVHVSVAGGDPEALPLCAAELIRLDFTHDMDRQSVWDAVTLQSPYDRYSHRLRARWVSDRSFIITAPCEPASHLRAGAAYRLAIGAEARSRSRRAVEPVEFEFGARKRTVFTRQQATDVARGAYAKRFGLEVPHPASVRNELGRARHWTSSVYLGDMLYRLYILDDGTVLSDVQPVLRPGGRLRLLVVGVERPDTDLRTSLFTTWRHAQELIAEELAAAWTERRLEQPPIEFDNTNLLSSSCEPDDSPDGPRGGLDPAEFDIVACLDLDPHRCTGGRATTRAAAASPELADHIVMGWFFGPAEHGVFDEEKALRMARALYYHEIPHLFGWEHRWAGEATRWAGRDWQSGLKAPELLGWTDVDGDGRVEVQDPDPYGGVRRLWPRETRAAASC